MIFQADSIFKDVKRKSNETRRIANNIISNLIQNKDCAENESRKEVQKKNHIIKESVLDKWAVFVNNIG